MVFTQTLFGNALQIPSSRVSNILIRFCATGCHNNILETLQQRTSASMPLTQVGILALHLAQIGHYTVPVPCWVPPKETT